MPDSLPSTGIDPKALIAIRDLELRARVVVEGLWSGMHRSPLEGFSVEFTEYRQYSPGDDLRYLDWKALARTDREYIKKFEDETNLRCHIILDTSKSMSFGSLDYNKAEYADQRRHMMQEWADMIDAWAAGESRKPNIIPESMAVYAADPRLG